MNHITPYAAAEWLAYNRDVVRQSLEKEYDEAAEMKREDAINYIQAVVFAKFLEDHPTISPSELTDAFTNDKVLEVLDIYYTREFHYEH